MSQRALALAAVLLLAAAPAFAADPGARTPISTAGAVNDVALAALEGTLGIATQDPGGRLTVPPNPSAPVWYMYSPDGRNLLQDGDADVDACDGASLPSDDCTTHATHVELSQDGTRMVVASTADDGNPVLTFVRDASGPLGAVRPNGVVGTVVDLAMSEDGQTIALITNTGTANVVGHVYLFNWGAGTSTTPGLLWSDDLQGGAVGDLALSPDGQSLAVTQGGDHHRYKRANNNQVTDANFSGNGMDAAIANGGRHLSVAGSSDGWFILYTDDTPSGGREVRIRDETVSLDAVAIRRDATAIAVANAAGTLWVYNIDPSILTTSLVGKVNLGTPARELAFARDGLSVAIAHGNDVSHYAVESGGLVKLWTATLASSAGDVAIDEHGDRVAAATGTQTIVYEARHKVDVTAGSIAQATPGQKISVPLTFANTGNRMESAALSVQGPAGWGTTLEKTQLRIAPDTTVVVRVNVTVPASASPGPREVKVTSAMGAAGSPVTTLTYNVPAIESWALAPDGPTSLAMQAGGSNSYIINITNRGNVAKEPPIAVTASPGGWLAELTGHTGTLAGGASRQATVKLTAPAGAPQLAQGKATVTLTGASPLELVGTVGASFGVDLSGAPGVTVSPNSTRIALTVKNTGNAPDTIALEHGNLPTGWTVTFRGEPEAVLGAGATVEVHADLAIQPGAAPTSPVEVTFTARSQGDSSKVDSHRILVSQPAGSTQSDTTSTSKGGGGKGSPGLGPLALLAAVMVVGLCIRRR